MPPKLTLAQYVERGTFRAERHADLLATSSPLPQECPVQSKGFPRVAQLWDRMVSLQATAIAGARRTATPSPSTSGGVR